MFAIFFVLLRVAQVNSSFLLKVRQEPGLGSALGHQKGFDYGFLHWLYVAGYLPLLWSGLLVWLLTGCGH